MFNKMYKPNFAERNLEGDLFATSADVFLHP